MKATDKFKLTSSGYSISEIDIIDKFMKATGRGMDNALAWLDIPNLIVIAEEDALDDLESAKEELEEYNQLEVVKKLATLSPPSSVQKICNDGIILKYKVRSAEDKTKPEMIREAAFNAIRYFVTKKVIIPISKEVWNELYKRAN